MDEETRPAASDYAFEPGYLSRYFFEHSPQPKIAVQGPTHLVRYANEAFARLCGIEAGELIGHPFVLAVPEGLSNSCVSLLDRVYRTGTPGSLAEQKHGQAPPVFWSYTASAILGIDQRPVGVMILVTDSTEAADFRSKAVQMNEALLLSSIRQQELAEAADASNKSLEAAIKAKEYFIAVLSHELRMPLTPILLAASILARDQRLDAQTRETLAMIHRNVTLEARLIDDLLDVTRMERGKLKLDRRPIDLREVLERSVEVCRADLEVGSLRLDLGSQHDPQIINADAGRLQQVFSNLLGNAIKFTPPGGHVRVRICRDGDSSKVEISDSGVGIDAQFLPKAFSAFEQGDKTHSRKRGLGLGLAICRMIITLHGGTITAASEGKDRGATFVVCLPAMADARLAPAENAPAARDEQRGIKPLRILMVEDHVDTARVMRRLLKLDGHTVEWAADVATALKLAAAHTFDLILSDLGLPDGTGMDLMRTLRHSGSMVPGIVISGYGQDQDIELSRQAGFVAHLVKPLNLDMLKDAIAAIRGLTRAT
jgi:two-component system CheB/CheR fusion protein